jgi:subtilase family serine protease
MRDRGRCSATQSIDVSVILRLNHRTQLDRLIEEISRPRSPRYHRLLTPHEFAERFAPHRGSGIGMPNGISFVNALCPGK